MVDGGTITKVQEGVNAAKELTPLAAQYPMAFAMLLIALGAFGVVIVFYRRDVARSAELSAMIAVNRDQAVTQEVMSSQLEPIPLILTTLAVMAQLLGMEVAKTQLDAAAAEAKNGKEALKRRRFRTTGSVSTIPAGGPKEGD